MKEVWREVQGYGGKYKISSLGKIQSFHRKWGKNGKILRGTTKTNGYRYIILVGKNGRKPFRVHRLVAEAFISNPENKPYINHKNGRKDDNRVENLEWVSPKENTLHAKKNGLMKKCYEGSIRVECVETGEQFESINDASRKKGINADTIRAVIHQKPHRHSAGGFHWKLI